VEAGAGQHIKESSVTKKSFVIPLLIAALWGQSKPTNNPSLTETLQWLQNTLEPSAGNGSFMHHPFRQPYPPEWVKEEISPYHSEVIQKFSSAGCRVTATTVVTDRDMGFLLGKIITTKEVDTFSLSDIDPRSIRFQEACEAIETSTGPTEPMNCRESKGKSVEFSATNNLKKIHREESASVALTSYGEKQSKKFADLPSGEQQWKQSPASEFYKDTFAFHDHAYALRFVQAFRHAVELCGGKPSSF
jgi:hypothetical protein